MGLISNQAIKDAWSGSLEHARKIANTVRQSVDRRANDFSKEAKEQLGFKNTKNITLFNKDPGLVKTNGEQYGDLDRIKSLYHNKDGSYNKTAIAGTIAGSYIGVASAGRIASGGGLYRDSDGNFDLMGIPLI